MLKRRPPILDIFPSRDIQLKRHKIYSLPFRQPQTSLTTTPTTNSKSPPPLHQTLPPKLKISPPINPKLTAKHSKSFSVNDKLRFSKKDITFTASTTSTPNTTTTTSPNKIAVLISIITSPPPRFHMPSSHISSITTPLSLFIHPAPIFPWMLQELLNRGSVGHPLYIDSMAILKNHHSNNKHNNNNNNNNNNTVSTTHTQEKSISSPHSNRSDILCHNFASNSSTFYFSGIYLSKDCLSLLRTTKCGIVLNHRTTAFSRKNRTTLW